MDGTHGRRLIRHGFLILLIGLLTGFAIKLLHNPMLGLGAHLIGIVNGIFLLALGLVWKQFVLSERLKGVLLACALYGAYGGWASNLLGAVFGTSRMTPMAGAGFQGAPWQENLVMVGLISVAISLIGMCLVALWGLRAGAERAIARPVAGDAV